MVYEPQVFSQAPLSIGRKISIFSPANELKALVIFYFIQKIAAVNKQHLFSLTTTRKKRKWKHIPINFFLLRCENFHTVTELKVLKTKQQYKTWIFFFSIYSEFKQPKFNLIGKLLLYKTNRLALPTKKSFDILFEFFGYWQFPRLYQIP